MAAPASGWLGGVESSWDRLDDAKGQLRVRLALMEWAVRAVDANPDAPVVVNTGKAPFPAEGAKSQTDSHGNELMMAAGVGRRAQEGRCCVTRWYW